MPAASCRRTRAPLPRQPQTRPRSAGWGAAHACTWGLHCGCSSLSACPAKGCCCARGRGSGAAAAVASGAASTPVHERGVCARCYFERAVQGCCMRGRVPAPGRRFGACWARTRAPACQRAALVSRSLGALEDKPRGAELDPSMQELFCATARQTWPRQGARASCFLTTSRSEVDRMCQPSGHVCVCASYVVYSLT